MRTPWGRNSSQTPNNKTECLVPIDWSSFWSLHDLKVRKGTHSSMTLLKLISINRWTDWIWKFHLTSEHKLYHGAKCQAALQTSVLNGFFAEMVTTFVSRIVGLEALRLSNQGLADFINSITTVVLSISGKVTSQTICRGTNKLFVLFWVLSPRFLRWVFQSHFGLSVDS